MAGSSSGQPAPNPRELGVAASRGSHGPLGVPSRPGARAVWTLPCHPEPAALLLRFLLWRVRAVSSAGPRCAQCGARSRTVLSARRAGGLSRSPHLACPSRPFSLSSLLAVLCTFEHESLE